MPTWQSLVGPEPSVQDPILTLSSVELLLRGITLVILNKWLKLILLWWIHLILGVCLVLL